MKSVERSQALFGKKAEALSRLTALTAEGAEQGWDGEAADPIHPLAALWVERFVRVLPDDVPLPEFAPEPDGAISLDWIVSHNLLFSLSVGRTGRLAFAWLDETDVGYGVARFDGQNIPQRILQGIDDIVGRDAHRARHEF